VSHVFLSYSRRDQAFVDRLIAFWNAYRGSVAGGVIRFLLQDDRGSPPLEFTAERAG
jgi:hypothetical protein